MYKISILSLMLLVASPAQGMGSKPDPGKLRSTCSKRDLSHVKAILKMGVDVNEADEQGRTALMYAAWEIYLYPPEDVSLINGHAADKLDHSPLMLAALKEQESVVAILIKWGADVNAADKWSQTALHVAAYAGHAPVVAKLITARANVYAVDIWGKTALMRAEEEGHVEAADEIRWGDTKSAWLILVVQQQRAASQSVSVERIAKRSRFSDSGRVEVVE